MKVARLTAKNSATPEIVTVHKGQIVEVEVYFGWSIPHEAKLGDFISGPG